MYKFILHGEKHDFRIEVDGPTEEELKTIDGPEYEGDRGPEDIIQRWRIKELYNAIRYGYTLTNINE